MRAVRRVAVLALVAGPVLTVPADAFATSVSALSRTTVAIAGVASRPGASAAPLASSAPLELALGLRLSDASGLQHFLAQLDKPGSADYRRYLTPSEFAASYGPSAADVAAVERWAASSGLVASRTGDDVTLTGRAGAFGRALSTTFDQSRSGALSTTRAATLPASLASAVSTVSDATPATPQPLGVAHGIVHTKLVTPPFAPAGSARTTRAARATDSIRAHVTGEQSPAATACATATTAESDEFGVGSGYTMDESGEHYDTAALRSAGDLGAGETIGIYEAATFSMADIDAYEQCMGISTSVMTVQVNVDPCPGCSYSGLYPPGGIGSFEAELDIEEVITQAPDASIVVYEGDDVPTDWDAIVNGTRVNGTTVTVSPDGTEIDTTDDLGMVVPPPDIVTTSWGWYEEQGGVGEIADAYEPIYEQAAAEGQSIFVASGDSDTTGLIYPADSPEVTAVGGTDILGNGAPGSGDDAWSASTGGYSPLFDEPSFQQSVAPGASGRAVPDLALNAGVPQMVYDTNYFTISSNAEQLAGSTGGSLSFTDTDGTFGGCGDPSDAAGYYDCTASTMTTGDTLDVAFAPGSGGYSAASEQSVATSGTQPTSTSLELDGSNLTASVTEITQEGLDEQGGIEEGGTVSIHDTRGLVTDCTDLAVQTNGVAQCSVPSSLADDAVTDTLTATYTGDSTDGPSSGVVSFNGAHRTGTLTTVNLLAVETSTPGVLDYQAYLQSLEGEFPYWQWLGADGTSAAAPMMAGLLADVADTCSTTIGDLAPTLDALYGTFGSAVYGKVLNDVTVGSNPTDGTSAAPGWDPVTGLGTPIASGMACPEITSLSPSSAAAGAQVTVTGTNLSLASFDFGQNPATVLSRTADSAVLEVPAGSGSVSVTPELLADGASTTFTYQTAASIAPVSATTFPTGTETTLSIAASGTPLPTVTESGALPSGVSFEALGGGAASISGTPAAGSDGEYPITLTAANGVGPGATSSFDLIVGTVPTLTSLSDPPLSAGGDAVVPIDFSGSPTPTVTLSGSLPAGLRFESLGGGAATISGIATVSGTYSVDVVATNLAGSLTEPVELSIAPAPTLDPSVLPTAVEGAPYATTVAVEGGIAPYAWSLAPGSSLPAGLALSGGSSGLLRIVGTPTDAGTTEISLEASDLNGATTDPTEFTLTVATPGSTSTSTETDPTAPAPAALPDPVVVTDPVLPVTVPVPDPSIETAPTTEPEAPVTLAPTVAAPITRFLAASAVATSGAVDLPLGCGAARCAGVVTLSFVPSAVAGVAGHSVSLRVVPLGSAHFALGVGHSTEVTMELNAAGKALLAHAASRSVTVRVRVVLAGGQTTTERLRVS